MIMNIKQKKIQIEPKVKLNYNMYMLDVCSHACHSIKHAFVQSLGICWKKENKVGNC